MKKLLVIITLCLPALLVAQMTYVPDDNFEQALIDLGYDTPPLNDSVPTKNIDTLTVLKVTSKNISDLTGIEDFVSLDTLVCFDNNLTSLDVSKNTALIYLGCYGNELTSLDVSKNISLTGLGCGNNVLTSLDVSKNTALSLLSCYSNSLTSLDVSKNTALTELFCYSNNLTSLDVSKHTALSLLNCYRNSLTSLDVSKNTALTLLFCGDNALTSLDVSNNSTLTWLYCGENQLTSLDVTKNSSLTELFCFYNALTSLDVSKNTALTRLACQFNLQLYCIQVADSSEAANNVLWKKDSHTVYSEDCSLVSVEEETNPGNSVTLSPNPASDYIEISGVVGEVKVFDVLGAEVLTHPQTPSREGELRRIYVSSLSPGVYFVSVGGKMYKFVKM